MRNSTEGKSQMSSVFFGGMPTESNVRALVAAFGTLAEGQELTHAEIAAAADVQPGTNRYRTVVGAWRAYLLKHHNIELGAVKGAGFRVLNSADRIGKGVTGARQGVRKIVRSVVKASRTVTTDPELLQKQALLNRFGAAIHAETLILSKSISLPAPAEQTPRASP